MTRHMANKTEKDDFSESSFSWCERRDTVLLRKPYILVDPMLRIRYPTSDFEAKNSSPNCFLNASHPLRVQVPYMIYLFSFNKTKNQIFRSGLVRETGLEPVRAAPPAPQTCASADSATLAYLLHSLERLYTIPPIK